MKLRSPTESQDQIAPEWLGSYARTAVTWIEGNYLTLRPTSSSTSSIYAYLTELRWDEKQTCIAFQETERVDGEYAQTGVVSVPHQTGHVYLVTSKHGQYRLAILSRPSIKGEMFGILTTLQTGRGSQLLPIATAIALVPQPPEPKTFALGRIDPDNPHHAEYAAILRRAVLEDFARLLTLPVSPAPP